MKNKLANIILGDIFRSLLTSIATFWATKHAIGAEVAQKLLHGDTVLLWQGTVPISLPLITSVLVGLALPIVLPITLGILSRISEAYKLIVARASAFSMTRDQLKVVTDEATVVEKIKAVATNTAPPEVAPAPDLSPLPPGV